MNRDLDDPINEDLINFVITYQSAVSFPIYTLSNDSLMIQESLSHNFIQLLSDSSYLIPRESLVTRLLDDSVS